MDDQQTNQTKSTTMSIAILSNNFFARLAMSDCEDEHQSPIMGKSAPPKKQKERTSNSNKNVKIMSIQEFEEYVTEKARTREREWEEYMETHGCARKGCDQVKDGEKKYCSNECYDRVYQERYNNSLEREWIKYKTNHPCYGCGAHTTHPYCYSCNSKYKAEFKDCQTKGCDKITRFSYCKVCVEAYRKRYGTKGCK